jgi:uncharacterized lipoprotein YbaY/membrane-bound inhibitor of C-type lysozyme
MTRSLTKSIAATTLALAVALSSIAPSFAAAGPLTPEQLSNAAYPIPDAPGGTVQLADGKYEDAENQYAVEIADPRASGDLNADSNEDAVVHLVVNSGGSGVFSYLSAVLNDNGTAKPLSAVFLGDRIVVQSIRVARDGEVSVLLLERRFDQPMSARPTIPVVRRFKVANDQLVASSPLSASEVNNATYPLEVAKGGYAAFSRGVYEDKDARVKAILSPSPRATGDLNGDTSPDTAVAMIVNSGGSGVFTYVSAVLNNGGIAKPVDTVFIGDRVSLSSLSIADEELLVTYLDRLPDEPMSARPTVTTTKRYQLENDKLVELGDAATVPQPLPATPIQQVDFTCADGVTFTVVFAGEVATVTFNGETQELPIQPSGSGYIYANENWKLQGKGAEATLTDLKSNTEVGTACPGKAFEAIVPAGPLPVPAAAPTATTETTPTTEAAPTLTLSGVLTGEVFYLQRIALPDNAVLTLRLMQVMADAAPSIVSQTIQTQGMQVPFPFELKYDPRQIDPEGAYIVDALITVNGRVRWAPVEMNYVLTNGAPATDVRIRVNPVASVGQRDSQPAAAADVVAALSSDPRFSTLVSLASEAGLVETLTNLKDSTIFAPTNDAFAKLPAGAMDELKGNKGMLTGILQYHVSPEKLAAKDIVSKTEVSTLLEGFTIRVKVEEGKVVLNEAAQVEQADIVAGSNVVHVVSEVLLPAETFSMASPGETLINAEFTCVDGMTMSVVFDNGNRTAAVTFNDQTVTLPQQVSGSGIRYANDEYALRGKGEDATLADVKTGNVVLADCKEQKPAETTTTMTETMPALSGVLTGSVTYRERIALSPDAVITVTLADVSKMDVAATMITTQVFTAAGKQVPFPFEMTYDPVAINPAMSYAVQARITENGQLRFINTTNIPVLTRNAPVTDVEVVVDPVGAAPAATTPTTPTFSGVLTGVVTYRERIALSPDAVITVTLQDTARAGAPATVIASQTFTAAGNQVPFAFELNYDPAAIDMRMRPTVSARITENGELRFISTRMNPVLLGNNAPATDVTIEVQPVGASAASTTPVTPTAPITGAVLTGTVTYLQRMALPPNAVIEVVLADVSRADAPATIIATQTITAAGKQVPFPFELTYDPASIQPQNTYAVQARILVDGKLRFISTQRYAVLTNGRPMTGVNIVVQPVQ